MTRTASLQETQAPKLYAIFSIFLALPLIAVGLRLVARRASNLRLWWDDWLILVATVGTLVVESGSQQLTSQGDSHHQLCLFKRRRVLDFSSEDFTSPETD